MSDEASKAEKKVDETYNDPSADLTLISEDDVLFHVDSLYLRANSSVFHNMMAVPPSRDINTTIPVDASSNHLRVFLDLLRGLDVNTNDLRLHYDHEIEAYSLVETILQLCRTFDCPVHRDSILLHVDRAWRDTRSPWRLVCIAADFEDVSLAGMAISWMGATEFGEQEGWCAEALTLDNANGCKNLSYLLGFIGVASKHCKGSADPEMDDWLHLYDWEAAAKDFSPAT